MLAYIVKRILLMIPTLLGALTITFVVMQFVPGGPVEQIMAEARVGADGDSGGYKAGRDLDKKGGATPEATRNRANASK